MKKTNKALAAALAACMTVSAMAAPAYAAGYSKGLSSSGGSGGSSYSSSVVYVSNSEVKVINAKLMEASIDSGKAITIKSDDAKVNDAAMAVIKKQKEPVVFKSKEYTVSIDPKKITTAKNINLGMKVDLFPQAGVISVDPVQKGDFGLEMVVTIPAEALKDFNLKGLKFFYVGKDGSRKELKEFAVNKDGSLSFKLSHASSYVFEESTEDIDTADGLNDCAVLIG